MPKVKVSNPLPLTPQLPPDTENWERRFDAFIDSLVDWETEHVQSKSNMFAFILRIKDWIATELQRVKERYEHELNMCLGVNHNLHQKELERARAEERGTLRRILTQKLHHFEGNEDHLNEEAKTMFGKGYSVSLMEMIKLLTPAESTP